MSLFKLLVYFYFKSKRTVFRFTTVLERNGNSQIRDKLYHFQRETGQNYRIVSNI